MFPLDGISTYFFAPVRKSLVIEFRERNENATFNYALVAHNIFTINAIKVFLFHTELRNKVRGKL